VGLKSWAERKAMGKITATLLKKAAEGDFGEAPKNAYWALAGRKTQIAAALAFAVAVVEAADRTGVCAAFGIDCSGAVAETQKAALAVSGLLVYFGQVDGALRTTAPGR
jgi:hypothetical protein